MIEDNKVKFNYLDYQNKILLINICSAQLDKLDGLEFYSLNP